MVAPTRTRRPLTLGSLIEGGKGINLQCKCGHRTALLPEQITAMAHPQTHVLEFKRRFRCSMCGRSGASDDIQLATFEVMAPFIDRGDHPPRRAPSPRLH